MISVLDKYTGYIFTPSPNCMMSSSAAMEILCITHIDHVDSISSNEKLLAISDCNIFVEN